MLSYEVFTNNFETLTEIFINWKFDLTNAKGCNTWFKQFEYMADSDFERMINDYIKQETFPPTVSALLKYYRKISPNANKLSIRERE